MIPFTVIGGYLGAGKTTLLNNILRDKHGPRIALLINDFGEINIDAALIESQTESQINLTNGCICCTLSDGFSESIERLCQLTPLPEHIIVEASGVADIHNLAQYGHGHDLILDGVLVLADAETVIDKANDKYVAQTIRRQLDAADLIVLNKVDLPGAAGLTKVEAWLAQHYPDTALIKSIQGNVPLSLLLGSHDVNSKIESSNAHHHERYATWKYQSDQPVSKKSISTFIEQLDDSVIRAKGIARLDDGCCVVIQIVGDRKELIQNISFTGTGINLVAIGLEGIMDLKALDNIAGHCFTHASGTVGC